jgi:hypothetical protein
MSRCRAPWAAALLPLVAMGSAWAAEPAAPAATPELSPEAAAALAARRAVMAGLLEKALADCAVPPGPVTEAMIKAAVERFGVTAPAQLVRTTDAGVRDSLMAQGNQAVLILVALIDPLGNVRYVHFDSEIANSTRNSPFDPYAIRGLRGFKYKPAIRGSQPVASWRTVKFTYLAGPNRMGNILSDEKLTAMVVKAREGAIESQMAVSYLDSIAHQEVGIPETEARHFLAASAVQGERSALLRVTRMMGLPNCRPQPVVEDFLYRAAMVGRSDLELLHATRILERGSVADHPELLAMLRGAANADDAFVQMWAAGLLATAPFESVRDPQAALAAAQALKTNDDPDAGETLAAALAANGRYPEAVAAEKAAIANAGRWNWNTANMRLRLARYTAGEPWVGYLCDCDRLVPAGGF